MRGMRILHTADLHLRAAGDERWQALAAVLDRAESLDVNLVVISGDMFDKSVEAQRLKPALREVFAGRPIPVVILPGNHDEKGLRAGDFFHERAQFLCTECTIKTYAEQVDVRDRIKKSFDGLAREGPSA